MPLSDLLDQRLQRLVPHEGLVVDVNTWNIAHNYHAEHQRLHSMAMHNAGIVTGLEVVSWNPPDNSVVINPGIAIDSEGRTIIVGEPQRFRLQTSDAGTSHIVLQYREVPSSAESDSSLPTTQGNYLLEAYMLQVMRELPSEPHVELARIRLSGSSNTVTDALNPFNPEADEIDTQYRLISGPRPLGIVRTGIVPLEMTQDGYITHSLGAMNLTRTINNTTRYRAEFKGSINLAQEITDCDLLLMSGRNEFHLADTWVEIIRRFMDRGGVLMGEASRDVLGDTEESPPFRNAFVELVGQLNRTLSSIERGHTLLNNYYLFGQPPEGVDGQSFLVADDGVIYSDGDYGSLWEGGKSDALATREQIRSALEFGVNIGIYASDRARMQMARLSAQ